MIQITQTKKMQIAWPQARFNNAPVTCASVDRSSFDYAVVRVTIGANDCGFSTFKVQESDDNATWTDVPGTDFSIAPLTLPTSANVNTLWEWQLDLRPRKRYLRPALTAGNGTVGAFVTVSAELSRAEQTPITATAQGLAGLAVA
jgi:hypothetical protein